MDPAWNALVFILMAAALGWFWHDSLAAREAANAAAQEACQRLALQLLDGTVAFVRIRLTRGRSGVLTLRRQYVFDYTANSIERRQGFVVLVGRYVEAVGYAPGEEARHHQQPIRVESQRLESFRPDTVRPEALRLDPPRPEVRVEDAKHGAAAGSPADEHSGPVADPSAAPRTTAKVFSIEDWRRNRQRRPPATHADDVDDARR